jgi:hypothetical protein
VVSSANISMNASVYAGLAVTSVNPAVAATAEFTNVTIR